MKIIPITIFVLLLLSCGEQKKQQQEEEWSSEEVENSRNMDLALDTVLSPSASKEEAKPTSSSTSLRTSSKCGYEEEYNNMRGFDPASEDDMDDNGMSRYMENNDEEGWD